MLLKKRGGILNVTKFRESIFFRLVVTFLIIMIPIYMLGIYIFRWSMYNVKNEISKTNMAQVSFYLDGLELEIRRIKILQYDCLNDENLFKLSTRNKLMSKYETNESMRLLQQRLVTIKNSSNYIKNVSVHFYPIKKTISSNDGIDDFENEIYDNIRTSSNAKAGQIINYKGGLFLSTFQRNYVQSPDYIITIELNRQAFILALSRFNMYDESCSFLVNLDDYDEIITQSEENKKLCKKEIIKELTAQKSINKADTIIKGIEYYEIENKGYYILHVKSNYLNMLCLKYIPEELMLQPIRGFYLWGWGFSAVVVFFILIYSLSTYKLIHKPLIKLVKSFNKVENGDLQVNIEHGLKDEFGYLYKCFNKMMENLNTLIDQVYNQKILMQRAELKQLQAQINPHFLYNSFFAINTMAQTGDENLVPFTKQLGEYFRFITRNSSDRILLKEEVNHAKVYTEIQLMRFTSKLQIKFSECPEKYHNMKVPRLILQPIIENAFNHGLTKNNSTQILSVGFQENTNGLDVIIEDNGLGMTDADIMEMENALKYTGNDTETTGIINIHRRIRLVFGQNSGVQISKSDMGGLKVILRIEIQTFNEPDRDLKD